VIKLKKNLANLHFGIVFQQMGMYRVVKMMNLVLNGVMRLGKLSGKNW